MKERNRNFYDEVSSEFAYHVLEAINDNDELGLLKQIILKTDW